jgi:hypothetical protein
MPDPSSNLFVFVSGHRFGDSPEFPHKPMAEFLKNFGIVSLQVPYTAIPPGLKCKCMIGHSFGADKVIEEYNQNPGIESCLVEDYVDKESVIGGITLIYAKVLRPNCKSIHRPFPMNLIFPCSAGIIRAYDGPVDTYPIDETVAAGHGEFCNLPRVNELLVRQATNQGWN